MSVVTSLTQPPFLKKGDKVAITCPAKKLPKPMDDAIALLQSWGLEVVLGETVNASYHQFAGDDKLRAKDLQRFIDDNSIKAIIAARGGYGSIRIIDNIDFSNLTKNPKWLVGFSDITIFHSHLQANCGLQSIHGQMPVNMPDASRKSLATLRMALFGEALEYDVAPNHLNRKGAASGICTGGNLSLLIAALGSTSDVDYAGKILFIEDVGEYLYAIDRMMFALKRAGKLEKLVGLIVGGFSGIKDNDIPFGQTVEEIVMNVVKDYNYPVCFDFPAGHSPDNNSIIFGRMAELYVSEEKVLLSF